MHKLKLEQKYLKEALRKFTIENIVKTNSKEEALVKMEEYWQKMELIT